MKTLQLEDGRMIQASKFGQMEEASEAIELTEEEKIMEAKLRVTLKCLLYMSPSFYHSVDFEIDMWHQKTHQWPRFYLVSLCSCTFEPHTCITYMYMYVESPMMSVICHLSLFSSWSASRY